MDELDAGVPGDVQEVTGPERVTRRRWDEGVHRRLRWLLPELRPGDPPVQRHLLARQGGTAPRRTFALARSEDGGWIGNLETPLGGVVVDKEDGIAALLASWENVRNEALPRRQSIDLMKDAGSA
ncbi:Scr1 family TA system antitoxin-like transcriptional regulator [Micromonospora sp. SH-82]|uniref:Scr1 family TA system antitoxin-like transcriptional regulator n=1 Tax=Micromonospora sp. SH-82 TaxID=3132938 RepID=UPI003EB91BC2